MDDHGNAVFPHFDPMGLSGLLQGRQKSLWFLKKMGDLRLVFAESAIDALSHAALFPDTRARYASIGGEMNSGPPDLITVAIGRMPAGSEMVAALDAYARGRAFAQSLEDLDSEFLQSDRREDLSFKVHLPETAGLDWNEVLIGGQRRAFSRLRVHARHPRFQGNAPWKL